MVHLRVVVPGDRTERALAAVLESCPTVINVVLLRDAARNPRGDVILCDVAKEDTSVVLADLKSLNIHHDGSISLDLVGHGDLRRR